MMYGKEIPERGEYKGESYKIFSDYNDIHLFVEDQDSENVYYELLRRSGCGVRKVFPKGGKPNVVRAAQLSRDPKCVYLIDRDWDDLLGITYKEKNLIVLNKHSIENYLLNYKGFCALFLAHLPKENVEVCFSESEFTSLVQRISYALKPLFECFCEMLNGKSSEKCCGLGPGTFARKSSSREPDISKISEFVARNTTSIEPKVKEYFERQSLLDVGHGRFMLFFIWQEVRKRCKSPDCTYAQLLMRLAQVADIGEFKVVASRIVKTAC